VALNCAVLILGGEQHWPVPPLVLLVAHLPIAVLEGIVLGFTLGFVAKVKPEMLGCTRMADPACPQRGDRQILKTQRGDGQCDLKPQRGDRQ
jgi:hypothetical protein